MGRPLTRFHENDGGRRAAGFSGTTRDCVVRSIAIAAELPYRQVYDALYEATLANRTTMRKLTKRYGKQASGHASPRTGVQPRVYKPYLEELGWIWTPTMHIGSGCKVHLRSDELPPGRLIVRASKHLCAVVDGVLHDTYDCSRKGMRCVYGYWEKGEA
jgi:hypothetical protein